jgi:hypothetical protein
VTLAKQSGDDPDQKPLARSVRPTAKARVVEKSPPKTQRQVDEQRAKASAVVGNSNRGKEYQDGGEEDDSSHNQVREEDEEDEEEDEEDEEEEKKKTKQPARTRGGKKNEEEENDDEDDDEDEDEDDDDDDDGDKDHDDDDDDGGGDKDDAESPKLKKPRKKKDDAELPKLKKPPKKKVKRKPHSRKRRSLVHYLFVTVNSESKRVECVLCNLQMKFHLSNCGTHWENHHSKEFKILQEANTKGTAVEPVLETILAGKKQNALLSAFKNQSGGAKSQDVFSSPNSSIPTANMGAFLSPASRLLSFPRTRKASFDPRLRKELALLYFLVETKCPFNATSHPSFMVLKKEWGVDIDEISTVLTRMEPMFVTAIHLKEERLQLCGAVSCSMDFWTSAAKRKYLAIGYHGVSPEWYMVHELMDLIHFPGTTFAPLVANVVQTRIESHLAGDVVSVAIASDCGSDVKKARDLILDQDSQDCANHKVNGAVGDVFGDTASRRNKELLTVRCVKAICHMMDIIESDKNCRLAFADVQKIEDFDEVLQFVHRNDTRWEGLLLMLQRILRLQPALLSESPEAENLRLHVLENWPDNLPSDVFQHKFYDVIAGTVKCLEPISVMHLAFQDLKRPTASRVIGMLHYAKQKLDDVDSNVTGILDLSIALKYALEERFSGLFDTVTNCLKAALVDPSQCRFMQEYGVSQNLIEQGWNSIVDECVDFFIYVPADPSASASHSISKLLEIAPPSPDMIRDVCAKEVNVLRAALEKAQVPHDGDPLEFYRDNRIAAHFRQWCPKPLIVVRMLLSIPAGESDCERTFSWAHGFVPRLRTRTSNATLEMQLVLYDLFRQQGFDWEAFLIKMEELDVLNLKKTLEKAY